ncbi:glycosyltransferase [Winogradskyella eckloniae]|uniref:glycosyltransferase n=1 Tax=Winogradskyella eckloniae TaxID=1089306 RepID=UPI001566DC89|nr:glycosyltransferase [Winogradskyella eckloniae]NRD20813.1 glycosyltransferase [Winogradskyella eckloniae]
MKTGETLVLFTLHYPYGKKSETFIENEIQHLADAFKRVIIIPREKTHTGQRPLPQNVEVNDLLVDNGKVKNHFKYILGSFNRIKAVFKIYLYTVLKDKKRAYYLKGGYFIYYLANALNEAKLIESYLEKSKLNNPIFYDYWFVNSTLSLAYLKSQNRISNLYCRAHGFDVFNERWDCGSVPFRQYILKNINSVFAISNYNKQYFNTQLTEDSEKVHVAYLGVRAYISNIKIKPKTEDSASFLMVSCANLFPFKQIERIPELLSLVQSEGHKIRWIHFGDGPQENEVLEAAKKLPSNVSFEYKGHVANREVLEFYAHNDVDLFLSLSLKEGLPVSMMEAQSFGVPIMAYRIFGIPEIVNERTGVLLDLDASNEEISLKITEILDQKIRFNITDIKQFFKDNFSAESNYKMFTQYLLDKND